MDYAPYSHDQAYLHPKNIKSSRQPMEYNKYYKRDPIDNAVYADTPNNLRGLNAPISQAVADHIFAKI
jgi:hypothetical protein